MWAWYGYDSGSTYGLTALTGIHLAASESHCSVSTTVCGFALQMPSTAFALVEVVPAPAHFLCAPVARRFGRSSSADHDREVPHVKSMCSSQSRPYPPCTSGSSSPAFLSGTDRGTRQKARPPANEPKRPAGGEEGWEEQGGGKVGAGNRRADVEAGGEVEVEADEAETEAGARGKGKGRQVKAPTSPEQDAQVVADAATPVLIHSISGNGSRMHKELRAQKKEKDRLAAAEYKANSRLNNFDGNHPLVVVPLPPDAPRPRRAPAPRRNMGAIVTLTDELQAKKDAALLEALKGSRHRMAANLKRAAKATGTAVEKGDGGREGDEREGGGRHDQEGEGQLVRRCCSGA
ncbi:hypothetical protein C8F04DRAFT_1179403 [Mycena alexandri]|uniref:Uncharacterized protein n=1 Tax=Mycena alexandri TaxID=1745969 RepID=A0AAD6T4M2_9AGAR|nr:hypothetical protein C8F04DRAFT_1179403 [Mycena alexandri]